MGRELAAAIGRWAALEDHPVTPRLEAICDTSPEARAWFERVGTPAALDRRLPRAARGPRPRRPLPRGPAPPARAALPRHDRRRQGLPGREAVRDRPRRRPPHRRGDRGEPDVFVRCSSEMPYFPGALLAYDTIRSGALGELIEAENAFLHSSDLDRDKPINWKRQAEFCGERGRDERPRHARPAPPAAARLAAAAALRRAPGHRPRAPRPRRRARPLRHVGQRHAPRRRRLPAHARHQADRAARDEHVAPARARHGRRRRVLDREPEGASSASPSATAASSGSTSRSAASPRSPATAGAIFEFGFSDAILQMWAAFLAEREGALGDRLGCVTPARGARPRTRSSTPRRNPERRAPSSRSAIADSSQASTEPLPRLSPQFALVTFACRR